MRSRGWGPRLRSPPGKARPALPAGLAENAPGPLAPALALPGSLRPAPRRKWAEGALQQEQRSP